MPRSARSPRGLSPTGAAEARERSAAGPRPAEATDEGVGVADRPEVDELVRVDDRADARNLTVPDVESPDGEQPALDEKHRARVAVDLGEPDLHLGQAAQRAQPVGEGVRDPAAAALRARERGRLAATVSDELDVVGQQRLEAGEVTRPGRGEEAARQLGLLLWSRA